MKKTLFFFLLILATSSVSAQWEERSNGLPAVRGGGGCLSAADKDIAVIYLRDMMLYKTTDAGLNWTNFPALPDSSDWGLGVLEIIDKDNIWLGTNSDTARIYYSSDGGYTWQLQYEDPENAVFINYIEMFNADSGVAMYDPPFNTNKPAVFLRTTNGGENWISMNQDYLLGCYSGDMWRRVDFVDINVGYFIANGIDPRRIYKTTDGGVTWEIKSPEAEYIPFVAFYDANYGFASGSIPFSGGYTFRTKDGGDTWDQIPTPFNSGISVGFITNDPAKVWWVAWEHLFFSADSGNTWNEQPMDTTFIRGVDIEIVDDHYGWLYADNLGSSPDDPIRVFYNPDARGIVSSVNNEINTPEVFYLGQNYPNPFNPETNIEYSVAGYSQVKLTVYNVLGEEIATLVNEMKSAGSYQVKFNAGNLPGGVYFYKLTAGQGSGITKKMILLK